MCVRISAIFYKESGELFDCISYLPVQCVLSLCGG